MAGGYVEVRTDPRQVIIDSGAHDIDEHFAGDQMSYECGNKPRNGKTEARRPSR